jgi:glycosyltransferase involved in cell wall biosynthesis
MGKNNLNILVCLPTYNEVESIEKMIARIRKENFAIIVTDGGSNDGTKEKAIEMGIHIMERQGKKKGFGMRQALTYAWEKGVEVIVFIDCDMTYPVDRIRDLVGLMNGYDMVVGARKMSKIKLANRMANYMFTGFINFLYGSGLKDSQSGLRAMRVERFKDIITADGFDVEAQISCKALGRHYRIGELEVDYHPRLGKSKVVITDAFIILLRIIKCRFGKT